MPPPRRVAGFVSDLLAGFVSDLLAGKPTGRVHPPRLRDPDGAEGLAARLAGYIQTDPAAVSMPGGWTG